MIKKFTGRNVLISSSLFISLGLCGCVAPPQQKVEAEDAVLAIINLHASRVAASMERMAEAEGTIRATKKTPPAAASVIKNEALQSRDSRVHLTGPVAGNVDMHESLSDTESIVNDSLPEGLDVSVNLSMNGEAYSGSLESVIERICAVTGWSIGQTRGVAISPVIVTLPNRPYPAFTLLKKVGAKLNRTADIVVSEKDKTISISYPVR